MAEFTGINLQIERKKREITQWQVAAALHVSEDVIYRWESDKQKTKPTPDQVGDYLDFIGCPELWHRWMMSNCEHYRRRNIEAPEVNSLLADIVRVRTEFQDVLNMSGEVERDAIDGKIDNRELLREYRKEALQAKAAAQNLLDKLPEE